MTQDREAGRPPRKFAVYSSTGVHIGLWDDGKIASEVAAESPGNVIEELVLASEYEAFAVEYYKLKEALREVVENEVELDLGWQRRARAALSRETD